MTDVRSAMIVTKMGAAQSQLRTAIQLWFSHGDPVSVHALAYAAYEIIHTISKKRDPNRPDLLFDSLLIKEEHRKDFNLSIKKHANFFKHGNRDGETTINFEPELTELYLLFASIGLHVCEENQSDEELAFLWWYRINHPELLPEEGRKLLIDSIPIEQLNDIRNLQKDDFFQGFMILRKIIQGTS